jgi:transcriptional regulator with XRE-family HTH domain
MRINVIGFMIGSNIFDFEFVYKLGIRTRMPPIDQGRRMNIANYIVTTRRRMRMNQKEFAEALGVSQGSVSKWEAGKESPRAEIVEKIRQISGQPASTEAADEPYAEVEPFSKFYSVPLRGIIEDGRPYSPYGPGEARSLEIFLHPDEENPEYEAWIVKGWYDDMPRKFLAVFEIFPPAKFVLERVGRHRTILVETITPDEATLLSLEEIFGSDRSGYWLWPLDHSYRNRSLPALLNEDGLSVKGNTRPRGVLRYVLQTPPGRGSSFKY